MTPEERGYIEKILDNVSDFLSLSNHRKIFENEVHLRGFMEGVLFTHLSIMRGKPIIKSANDLLRLSYQVWEDQKEIENMVKRRIKDIMFEL